jgi:hypothetical protein
VSREKRAFFEIFFKKNFRVFFAEIPFLREKKTPRDGGVRFGAGCVRP